VHRSLRALALLIGGLTLAAACAKVPYTNRRQLNVIPDAVMNGVGKASYADTLSSAHVQRGSADASTLTRVGQRISKVANKPKYNWEYRLIMEPKTVNAWCLPGGHIGFYTGILPVLQNEAGMAFVMGHEVGHAVARHGAERMTQQLALVGGLAGLNSWIAGKKQLSTQERAAVMAAIGLGAEVGVMLPFSRAHESEADVIGMMYMANAGYPPAESLKVWDRMGAQGGAKPPAFLSTHPSDGKRKAHLNDWLPQAKNRFERSSHASDALAVKWR